MTDNSRELLAFTLAGKPPSTVATTSGLARIDKTQEAKDLLDVISKTSKNISTDEPVTVSIRYIRKNGSATPVEIVSGVIDTLQGVVYKNQSQLCEIFYTERLGEKEHYNLSVTLPEFQIPAILEPVGELGYIEANPSLFFPDDKASRWMLGLLLASEDIGVTMKLLTPYIMSPKVGVELHSQYRTSHMLYFWRLLLAHVHEAWCSFNKSGDPLIVKIKGNNEVKDLIRKINKLRGRKVVGRKTAGDFMESCRHSIFHYGVDDEDRWGGTLKDMPADFKICVTHSELKSVDTRWLIADAYLLSRLNFAGFSDRDLQGTTRDVSIEIINLIRVCQKAYFNERQPGYIE